MGAHADPVKFAQVQIVGAVTATMVAAVTGKKIRLHSFFGGDTGNVNLTFLSVGTATATISGTYRSPATSPTVLPWSGHGWLESNPGEALHVTKTGVTTFGGALTYSEVD
jgi:hypothetical protein